jgi:hypothetical protein
MKCPIVGYHLGKDKIFIWEGQTRIHIEFRCLRHQPCPNDMKMYDIREISQDEYESLQILKELQ